MRSAVLVVLALALSGSAIAQPTHDSWEKRLKIGQSVILRNDLDGWKFRITVLKYVDPARSNLGYRPRSGKRFIALLVRIRNIAGRRWQGTPVSYTELVTARGSVLFAPSYSWPVIAPPFVGQGFTLDPGEAQTGYFSFMLPKAMKLRLFRFLGTYDTASWLLRR